MHTDTSPDKAHRNKVSHHGRSGYPSIWAIAIAALLVMGSFLTWTSRDEYQEARAQEYRFLESHARFGDAQISGALRSMDLLLQKVIDDRMSTPALRPDAVQRRQLDILRDFPEIHFLITTDNQGQVITAESLDDPTSVAAVRKFNASQRDYFTVHRDAKQADFFRSQLSRPFKTITGRTTITVSRAIRDRGGRFLGVALVSVSPKYFETVLRNAVPDGKASAATLLNRFGDVISRIPGAETYVGRNLAGTPAFQAFLNSNERVTRHVGGGFDGVDRILVFSRVGEAPLGVAVSSTVDVAMRGWHHNLMQRLLGFFLIVVISLGLAWEIQRRLLARQATQEVEQRFQAYFERSMVGMATTSPDKGWIDVNPALCEMLGYSAEELASRTWAELTYPEDLEPDVAQFDRLLSCEIDEYEMDKRFVRSTGDIVYTHLAVRAIRRHDRSIDYLVALVEDITERKRAEERVHFLAFHDVLTELPNRLLIQDRFHQATAYADRSKSKVALLFLDLDNFKTINDSLGHLVGDELIKEVARRLTESVREMDSISRQGGDEFLIMLPALLDADAIAPVLVKLMSRIVEPCVIDGHELTTSASIGIALYPDDGRDFDSLLKKADMAMYRAKESGRNIYRFFDDQMNVEAVEQLHMRSGLRKALVNNEFILHYQPQVNLVSGALIGAEALIRWNHPELGMVPPGRFIQIAEDSGLIVPIGEWVLREACRQAASWQKAGLTDLIVAVNLSAVQFKRGNIEQSVVSALEESGLNPALLELELTESILIHDPEKIMGSVSRLKDRGVKLSIDDFGTGYSSLSYLKRFQVDKLKIDQSFVRDLANDEEDAAIVSAIIQMARSLGLTTIAEGVEDDKVLARLRDFGCDEAQGYYFARPMPSDDFSAFRTHMQTGAAYVLERRKA